MHCVYVTFQNILQLIRWKKTGLKGAHFNSIDTNSITDIHKYLVERT